MWLLADSPRRWRSPWAACSCCWGGDRCWRGVCLGAACCCNYLAVFVAVAAMVASGAWLAGVAMVPFLGRGCLVLRGPARKPEWAVSAVRAGPGAGAAGGVSGRGGIWRIAAVFRWRLAGGRGGRSSWAGGWAELVGGSGTALVWANAHLAGFCVGACRGVVIARGGCSTRHRSSCGICALGCRSSRCWWQGCSDGAYGVAAGTARFRTPVPPQVARTSPAMTVRGGWNLAVVAAVGSG